MSNSRVAEGAGVVRGGAEEEKPQRRGRDKGRRLMNSQHNFPNKKVTTRKTILFESLYHFPFLKNNNIITGLVEIII